MAWDRKTVADMGEIKLRTWGFSVQLTTALALVLAGLFAASPASAIQQDTSLEEIERAECLAQPYLGFVTGPTAVDCATARFLQTSAAFKCRLYVDQGYPSAMMERACQLFDQGYKVELQQGASAAE